MIIIIIIIIVLVIIIIIIIIIIIMALPRWHFNRVALHPPGGPTILRPLSKDSEAKEDHQNIINIQPHGQAGNRARDLQVSSLESY